MSSAVAIILIAFGVLSRFLPHPHAQSPSARSRSMQRPDCLRVWAIAVPVVALVVSDAFKVWNTQYMSTLWSIEAIVRYATFALIVMVAARYKTNQPAGLIGLSLVIDALLFYVKLHGLGVPPPQTFGSGPMYTYNFEGLVQCYEMALPFFRNSLAADLIGTGACSGSMHLRRSLSRLAAPLAVETIRVD